ncbi:hypothetical protein [Oceanobacillus damuensis]|uniref:hypothetical protein n=1 Tax=Oceanobacillus damuensis TaxID=937928 RepID=UPI000829B486|nr:hypothetical protein [Oceanobacillus damuensis]
MTKFVNQETLEEAQTLIDYLQTLDCLLEKANTMSVFHDDLIDSINRTKERIEVIMIGEQVQTEFEKWKNGIEIQLEHPPD